MRRITKDEATQWRDALVSGKYKQGRFMLHNDQDNSYCCLGVLCDILNFKSKSASMIAEGFNSSGLIKSQLLDSIDQLKYTKFNDDDHLTFKQIAKYVQKDFIDERETTGA